MKKLLLLLSGIVWITSCKRNFTINGTIEGVDGSTVFLEMPGQFAPVKVDSATITQGKFMLKGTLESPDIYFLSVDSIRGAIPVFLENTTMDIHMYKDSLQKSMVKGSVSHNEFQSYVDSAKVIYDKMNPLMEIYQKAQMENDTAKIKEIREKALATQEEVKKYSLSFVKNHPGSFVSPVILQQYFNDPNKDFAALKKIFEALSQKVKDSKTGKKIAKLIHELSKTAVGSIAPDFTGLTPDDKELSLKDVKGKVTIIDFWASWCKPCRAENPNVVALYNKYHNKGLNIIGVSLDKDSKQWKEAIKEDKLTWNHVLSPQEEGKSIADKYAVKTIPSTFIVDKQGVIIAKNLRGEELAAKIAEILDDSKTDKTQ